MLKQIYNRYWQHHWIYHPIFWIIYILFTTISDLGFYPHLLYDLQYNAIMTVEMLPIAYLHLYYLIPQLLLKRRYLVFCVTLLAIILPNVIILAYLLESILRNEFFLTIKGLYVIISETILLFTIISAIKILKHWYQKESYVHELEEQSLKAELALLKSQVNPHFLFNTLNNIYLLVGKRPKLAQRTIIQLSDMLSHQIYNMNKEKISLAEEIDYLTNYISLEKIRQSDVVSVNACFPTYINNCFVSPMLLIHFVENAFKHGNKVSEQGYWVDIRISLIDNELYFVSKNSYDISAQKNKKIKNGGIGISNVKRRLELLYPNQHKLDIHTGSGVYEVNLKIPLYED